MLVVTALLDQGFFRHRLGGAVAALQQADRGKARVQSRRFGEIGLEVHQGVFGFGIVEQRLRQRRVGRWIGQCDHGAQRVLELPNALFSVCAHRDDGDAQLFVQLRYVYADALFGGLVHQVDAEEHAGRRLHHLERQPYAAFQRRRVGNDDGRVNRLEGDEVARQLFLGAVAFHRAHAGQVDQTIFRAAMGKAAARHVHRFAGPIPRLLMQKWLIRFN